MKKIVCLISSPPESANAKRGLSLAEEWLKQGHSVQICLLQDGVYAALQKTVLTGQLEKARWYVLADDLKIRGFQNEDLQSGVEIVDNSHLVQMMMGEADQVMGAF